MMEFGNSRRTIILSDPLPMRRAAFVSLFSPWANENNIRILEDGDPASEPTFQDVMPVLLLVVSGAVSVEDATTQSLIARQRRFWPELATVFVSDREDGGEVAAAFRLGARGYVPTSLGPDLARQALGFILAGGTFFPPNVLDRPRDVVEAPARAQGDGHVLTPRQLDVLARLREGKSNKLIARDLSMCESTVKVHVRQIMRKLGAANRTQAALSGIGGVGIKSADPHSANLQTVDTLDFGRSGGDADRADAGRDVNYRDIRRGDGVGHALRFTKPVYGR